MDDHIIPGSVRVHPLALAGNSESPRRALSPMKTASLGLLEVPVVRVNAGGDAPPDPPSVGLSLFSYRKLFGELAGKYI